MSNDLTWIQEHKVKELFKAWGNRGWKAQFTPSTAKCPYCETKIWAGTVREEITHGHRADTYCVETYTDKQIKEMYDHLMTDHKEYSECKHCNAMVKTSGLKQHQRTVGCKQEVRKAHYANLGYQPIGWYIEDAINKAFNKALAKKIENVDWQDITAYDKAIREAEDEKRALLASRGGVYALINRAQGTWHPALLFQIPIAKGIETVHKLSYSGTSEEQAQKAHYLLDFLRAETQEERDSIQAVLELEVHGGQ